jgi:hypothetical protein
MAKEYIDREALKRDLIDNRGFYPSIVKAAIENAPTADVVEEVHGEWIDKPTGRYCHIGSYCSVCGKKSGIGGIESNRHKPYCPNCGAKMDGKDGKI